MSKYKKRAVLSGNIVETYEYSEPISRGYKVPETKKQSGRKKKIGETAKNIRIRTVNRARANFIRLVNTNVFKYKKRSGEQFKPVFLTLTFKSKIEDLKKANYEFKKFRERLNYYLKTDSFNNRLHYVSKPEYQKRESIHYHVLFFNLPFIPVKILSDLWGNGSVKVNAIEFEDVGNIGAYMSKCFDLTNDKFAGEKSYSCSRGLIKPKVLYGDSVVERVESELTGKEIYRRVYLNDQGGTVNYKQYNRKAGC